MKFKRILAVILSVLMLTSMASFTVSAEDAELMAEPQFSEIAAINPNRIKQNEKAIVTEGYDAENDIIYVRVEPNFASASTSGPDDTVYINMYTYGSGTVFTATASTLYAVCYFRSNYATEQSHAGFYSGLHGCNSGSQSYAGNEEWVKMIYPISIPDEKLNATSEHFWIRPIGAVSVNGGVVGQYNIPEGTYYDIAGVALFDDLASAEAYDIAALSSAKITISFDAGEGTGEFDSYDVAPGKYAASNVVFPTTAPTAPEGKVFNGWATELNGTPLTGDVATPDVDTTYYATYKYAEVEGDYDDIYLQNVYYKLMNDKNLTIGYLGGSVTVGAGATVSGPNSTTAWRALTTQWFKDNFPEANIKEVYAGIGGTGSRFGSYRMTRDLDLANNTIDLLFVDSCVNDQYEGFNYNHKEDLWGNDAVIVAKILENNPKCQIVFVNVPNNGTIKSAADSGAVQAHREFAEPNGFEFIDFKVAVARALTGDPEATYSEDISKWNDYFTDSVHPADAGYRVYFEYLRDELLSELVNEELNISKAKYEDTVPTVLDLDTVDTDRYCGGSANSNSLTGLTSIKNYLNGQLNGFLGGDSISASKAGYSTTFKFTGTNAYIWANQHSHNALLDVYLNDNVTVGSPDYTIDMWRNQESGQSYMFPVLPEDLAAPAETKVTLVLRQNVDQATRGETAANVGDRLTNKINNIAIKGGTMDSVEFLEAPDAFKTTVEYEDIVVPNTFFNKRIDGSKALSYTPGTPYMWIDGETEIDTLKLTRAEGQTGGFATDGYGLSEYSIALDHYNYVTYYLYVDDPESKTAGKKIFCNVYQLSGGGTTLEAEYEIVPNAWQRIPISLAPAQAKAQPFEVLKQVHFRPFGNGTTVENMDGVTLYLEKAVFSANTPGYWVDLDAKVTNIKVNGESVEGFNVNTYEYNVALPFGTTEAPVVTAERNINEAVVTIVQADSVDGSATVTLEGATDADDIVYTINFSVFDGIILNGINVGETAVALKDGITEYRVTLPTGTTAVPTVTADIEGDPAKITVTQADSLEGAATVALEGGVTYTITFYVMPSLEERYPGADIVYVSSTGAGTKDGTSLENAMAWTKTTVGETSYFAPFYAKKDIADKKVVYAVVTDITFDANVSNYIPKDTVITSVGGDLRFTNHPSVHDSVKGVLTIENIDIYHTRVNGKANDELYLTTRGTSLVMNNVNVYPYGELDGAERTALLYVQPGGDGGNFNVNEDLFVSITNVNGIILRGGGWGGTTINKGITYTIDGESRINSVLAGGHAVKGELPADQRTIRGDIRVFVSEDSYVGSVSAGNSSIVDGKMDYVIEGEVDSLVLGANNSAGSVTGGVNAVITGKVGAVTQGNLDTTKARSVVINTDTAEVGSIAGATHVVKYSGNGTVLPQSRGLATEAATFVLSSDTARWAEVTIDGVTKKYDMSTDTEVTLAAEDMTIEVPAGKEAVVIFDEGVGVTFKAYEADGAKADSVEKVTGLAGMAVTAPANPEVKNEHFEFVGWAVEGTTDIVTDFGTFTPNVTSYVAIFKEAPAVQFKAYAADGATADYDKTIYGITGNPVSDKMAADGVEAPAAKDHFTFKGWALEGTTDIVDAFGTFADQKAVYVAVYEEDAKATVTVYDGNDKVDEITDYVGFTYTFKKLDHTPTSRFVGYKLDGETEATFFADNEITVTADVTYYAVRNEIKLEDAEYTFEGRYDYSDSKYIVDMYYVGPKANMTAFGIEYDTDVLTNIEVEYSEELQSTGTNKVDNGTSYEDVVYPTEGASFGDDMKTPVYVATFVFDISDYAALDTETAIVKALRAEDITGAYKNGEWQYIKHSEDFSLDIAANVYPIYFTELVDNNAVTVTVEGVEADITTVTAPASAKMLQTIEFKAVTADGEEPALVSYYVDDVAMGELIAGDDGETYIIPAEKVLGDVVIEFSYGEPILEVAITGIEVPEVGEEPDTTAKIPANVNYTLGNVTWEPEADEFDFDTEYTVKVEVTAEEGYAFSGKTVYTINGETATVKKLDKDTVEVSFTFEPTVKELGTITVEAGLVRDADDRAYANFGTISVIDETGAVVASYEETADDEALAAEFEVLAGNYTVEIAKNGYLTYTKEITVVYKKNTKVVTDLVAGNLYAEGEDDDVINLLDFVRLTKAFTAETDIEDADALEAYRATVDIDEDGVVTVFDLAHIKANIGE